MFDELLRIKEFRESGASRALARARAVVAEKEQAVRDAKAALADHREFRVAEEARLFGEIRGETVKLEKLENMNQSIALMRDHDLELEESVGQAEKAVESAKEQLQMAADAYRDARKALQKFEEFFEIQKDAEQKAAEKKEEAAVEEVATTSYVARMRGTR